MITQKVDFINIYIRILRENRIISFFGEWAFGKWRKNLVQKWPPVHNYRPEFNDEIEIIFFGWTLWTGGFFGLLTMFGELTSDNVDWLSNHSPSRLDWRTTNFVSLEQEERRGWRGTYFSISFLPSPHLTLSYFGLSHTWQNIYFLL